MHSRIYYEMKINPTTLQTPIPLITCKNNTPSSSSSSPYHQIYISFISSSPTSYSCISVEILSSATHDCRLNLFLPPNTYLQLHLRPGILLILLKAMLCSCTSFINCSSTPFLQFVPKAPFPAKCILHWKPHIPCLTDGSYKILI